MNTAAVGISAGSLVVVMGTVVSYFRTIPRGTVPVRITPLVVKLCVGITLAISAVAWSYLSGSLGAAVLVPAAFATMMASGVLWLLTQRKTPVGDLKVKVGDELLSFEATTSDGLRFHTDELANKRTLLKFIRGGW
jgi:hypothetical protein